ncbi:MAG: regulatory protein RecX [Clostridia bacterium]|nr:regulatory protein RecX [Clostridia bacterium]
MEEVIEVVRRFHVCRLVLAHGGERILPLAMEREWPVKTGAFDAQAWDQRIREKGAAFAMREVMLLESRRDHTRAELKRTLLRYGYPEEICEEALEQMRDAGIVSDRRYADGLVRQKSASMGRGKMLYAMRQRGVDAETAESALGAFLEEDEAAAAEKCASRMLRRGYAREKVFRSLLARGYARSVCMKALSCAEEENADQETY